MSVVTKFVNLTEYDVIFYSDKPILTIKPSGLVVRAKKSQVKIKEFHVDGFTIPVFKMEYGEPEGIPDYLDEDTVYIVSSLAAQSIAKYRPSISRHFYVPSDTLRDEKGNIVGCKSLSQI